MKYPCLFKDLIRINIEHQTKLKRSHFQVLPSDPFGSKKWPFQGLSDLHLRNQRDTWKKLVVVVLVFVSMHLEPLLFDRCILQIADAISEVSCHLQRGSFAKKNTSMFSNTNVLQDLRSGVVNSWLSHLAVWLSIPFHSSFTVIIHEWCFVLTAALWGTVCC